MSQDVATLVDLTTLDLGQRTEDFLDGRGERLGSVDHEESGSFLIEAPVDEFQKQGSRD